MAKKRPRTFIRFLVGFIISALVGYVCTLIIPIIEPGITETARSLIKNTTYLPMTVFILLALFPMLVSFLVGFGLSLAFKPRSGRESA